MIRADSVITHLLPKVDRISAERDFITFVVGQKWLKVYFETIS